MSSEVITTAEAKERLKEVGYEIEWEVGILYARTGGSFPNRLYEKVDGFVSALAVKRLENAAALRMAQR